MEHQEPIDVENINRLDCFGLVNLSVLSTPQENLEQLYQRKVLTGTRGIVGAPSNWKAAELANAWVSKL